MSNVVERFIEYAKIQSTSKFEKEMSDEVVKDLLDLGFEVKIDDTGEKVGGNAGNIYGILKGNSDLEPMLFCAHIDTVTPNENIKPIIEDDVIKTDGTTILSADDKAGIASIVYGIKEAVESGKPRGDIEVLFTVCEEIGLLGAKNFDYSIPISKAAYTVDTGGSVGIIVTKGPFQINMTAEFIGVTSHAGTAPEKGISAIQMASHAISNMNLLKIDDETSANIGTIHGGTANNIVAEKCVITMEARSLDEEKLKAQVAHMRKTMEDSATVFSGSVNIEEHFSYPGVNIPEDAYVVQRYKRACEALDFNFRVRESRGGSDSHILTMNGIQTATISCGMRDVHTTNEHIKIKDLEDTVKLIKELILTI